MASPVRSRPREGNGSGCVPCRRARCIERPHGRLAPEAVQALHRGGTVLNTPLDTQMIRALHDARYMYVTTYSRAGKPGTVPTWLWPRDGHVYFTTKRGSLKARRI